MTDDEKAIPSDADPGAAAGAEGAVGTGAEVVDFPDAPAKPGRVLTMRQHKILQVIRDSVERRGYPPSVREIGQAAGLKSARTLSELQPHLGPWLTHKGLSLDEAPVLRGETR